MQVLDQLNRPIKVTRECGKITLTFPDKHASESICLAFDYANADELATAIRLNLGKKGGKLWHLILEESWAA